MQRSISLENEENGIYYLDFSESLKLKQVIIGVSSKITRSQVTSLTSDSVEIFKARAAFQSFKVVRNKNEDVWV